MKTAEPQHLPEQDQLNREETAMALRRIGQWGLGSLGVGGTAAGLYGLYHWLFKPKVPQHDLDLSPQEVELPYPERPAEPKSKKRLRKVAGDEATAQGDWADQLAGVSSSPSKPVPNSQPDASTGSLWDWELMKHPWVLPAGTAAAIGGLYGGNKLISWLASKRRHSEEEGELEDAKREYEQALLGMYGKKSAAADPLDTCVDALEKQAFSINDWLGTAGGMYLTLAGLLAGGTGIGMYNYLRSRSPDKTLEQALKQRAQLRALQNPPEISIHPNPVKTETEDDEDETI